MKIIGTYQGRREILDTAPTMAEAQILAAEYKMAFGCDWLIEVKK